MLTGKLFMNPYILRKKLNIIQFEKHIQPAQESNQFSNGGAAVRLLEERARDMLKISDTKAVIATSSGSSALHAILFAMMRKNNANMRVAIQDFNFPAASQGPATGPIITDIDPNCNMNVYDEYAHNYGQVYIITNCFGHIQDLESLLIYAQEHKKIVIFDNAATPYTFLNGINTCNLGNASFISLHHTKHIGFGEGGLAIVDRHLEEGVRVACNFGLVDKQFNERGSNFKMSEVSAAGILQYWDSFDIDKLQKKLVDNYYEKLFELNKDHQGSVHPNFSDEDKFLPACLPFIFDKPSIEQDFPEEDCKKYYYPLRGLPVSKQIYDRILCFPITEGLNK
jgi:dTDP-4-amino-4,6-dideoxygalactose transaminase